MAEIIPFPGPKKPDQESGERTQPPPVETSEKDPSNIVYEGDGVDQDQFNRAGEIAVSILEFTHAISPARETRELREELVETYSAAQVVLILEQATEREWRHRPEFYRALALRFVKIAKQHL